MKLFETFKTLQNEVRENSIYKIIHFRFGP